MPVPPGTEDTFGPWPGDVGTGGQTPPSDGDPTTPAIIAEGVPFWRDQPRIYDRVVIAGYELPGICSVDAEHRRKLDKKNAKGEDGATITDDGEDQAPVEVRVELYTLEDWNRFQQVVPHINPKGPGKRVGVSIDYPTLALFGITTIYVEAVSVPKFDGKRQFMTCTIRATEWRPPPKAAKASKSTTTDESKDSPKSNREARKATGGDNYTDEGQDSTGKLAGDGWSGDDDYETDTEPE
jgi:hypothetical protein